MEKLRLAKKTNPHASFHWSKPNFVSRCGSIGDRALLRCLTSNGGNHPKAVHPMAVQRGHFLPHYPQNGSSHFCIHVISIFWSPPAHPLRGQAPQPLVPACLGSVPGVPCPICPHAATGFLSALVSAWLHFWERRCYSKLMDSLRAV